MDKVSFMANKSYCNHCKKDTYDTINNGVVTCVECWQVKKETYKLQRAQYEQSMNNANQQNTITVECPYCHSTNTKKISGLAKGLKVAFWRNAAAGQIAKQWHCNNCGSDF